MTAIVFHKKTFFLTIGIFIMLTTAWTILCVVKEEFTDRDKGLVTGIGYLLLLSVSLYFGQGVKSLTRLGAVILLTFLTFLTASFILGLLVGAITNSMLLYSIAASLFVAVAMTAFLHKMTAIHFKKQTMALTFLLMLLAYFIDDTFSEIFYLDYHIHPRLTMFNVFQLALIVPLTLGMTIKKATPQ